MSRRLILDTAQALRDCRPQLHANAMSRPARVMWNTCVREVARAFARSNRAFDRERFLADCGYMDVPGNYAELEARVMAYLNQNSERRPDYAIADDPEELTEAREARADARIEAQREDEPEPWLESALNGPSS
jgi:hypothetical protein